MHETCVVIPAIKKSVAFADDLVKKLAGVTLVQRAIDKALSLIARHRVFVVTDSQEISLICERNGVRFHCQADLSLEGRDIVRGLGRLLREWRSQFRTVFVLYPYAPTISAETLKRAHARFLREGHDIMVSAKEEHRRIFRKDRANILEIMNDKSDPMLVETKAFTLLKSSLLQGKVARTSVGRFLLSHDDIEIRSHQDWWICERLLKRRRIVFRVIGNDEVGMGHIFRSMSLAHEITDHEVVFVCGEREALAVSNIAGHDYIIHAAKERSILKRIVELKPDLVVNDMLDTDAAYIDHLHRHGIRVLNFEDLGTGAARADVTINELYDEPVISGDNILWGNDHLFLRDEFISARPRPFRPKVQNLLLTFGGTDSTNLTMIVLRLIEPLIAGCDLRVFAVTGAGYRHLDELRSFADRFCAGRVNISVATGVMSRFMEKADLAVCSNGRTVYELAHMRVPAVVIAQHEREATHSFAREENGFVRIGLLDSSAAERRLVRAVRDLLADSDRRRKLHDRMKRFDFLHNKEKVIRLIGRLLRGEVTA